MKGTNVPKDETVIRYRLRHHENNGAKRQEKERGEADSDCMESRAVGCEAEEHRPHPERSQFPHLHVNHHSGNSSIKKAIFRHPSKPCRN